MFLKRLSLICCCFVAFSCSKDSTSEDQTPIEITVTASNFSVSIDENVPSGQVIGQISGSTNQGSVIFSITELNPAGAFSVNASSGELTVANESIFDFEINPTITGIVKVANGSVSQNATVTITLNDINEVVIFNGDVELLTQQEVDDFGASNYTHITGNLRIGKFGTPNSSIIDLSSLLSLISIGGYVNISSNESLTNLNGLNNIASMGGDRLQIFENASLTTINVFQNVTNIPGDLFIGMNESLLNLDGLENVTDIGGSVLLQDNISIENINGLTNLRNVGLNISRPSINIYNNDSLMNVDGLHNVTSIDGALSIGSNSALINIDGLSNITYVSGSLAIGGNDLITNLDGIGNITSEIAEILNISGNASMTNMDGLNQITSVNGTLVISENASLTNLDGIQNISSVSGGDGLFVFLNPYLEDLCGLTTLLNSGLNSGYSVTGNLYNPTEQDIIDGNCSL